MQTLHGHLWQIFLWGNIFWSINRDSQYNWLQNNIAQLYFILGKAKLCWNFSSWIRDASDIHRFPTLHMVEIYFLLENLWISVPSLGILENLQCSSAVPNIKYNCVVLFLSQLCWLYIYASKYISIITDTHTKIWTEIMIMSFLGRNYWSSCRVHIAMVNIFFGPLSQFTDLDSTRVVQTQKHLVTF